MTEEQFEALCKQAFNTKFVSLWTPELQERLARRMQGNSTEQDKIAQDRSTYLLLAERRKNNYKVLTKLTYAAKTSADIAQELGFKEAYVQRALRIFAEDAAAEIAYREGPNRYHWKRGQRWLEKLAELSLRA